LQEICHSQAVYSVYTYVLYRNSTSIGLDWIQKPLNCTQLFPLVRCFKAYIGVPVLLQGTCGGKRLACSIDLNGLCQAPAALVSKKQTSATSLCSLLSRSVSTMQVLGQVHMDHHVSSTRARPFAAQSTWPPTVRQHTAELTMKLCQQPEVAMEPVPNDVWSAASKSQRLHEAHHNLHTGQMQKCSMQLCRVHLACQQLAYPP